jgi:hypothetical protein
MATRIEITDVLIPAGTAKAAPAVVAANFDDGRVEKIELRWPPGPSGLVGLQIRHSNQVIIPYQANTFLITDDEVILWELHDFPDANAWSLVGYNLDVFDHTIQIRWLINDAAPTVSIPPLIPIG